MVDRYINSSRIFEIVPFDYFVVVGATAVSVTALVLIVLFFEFICNKCKKPSPIKKRRKKMFTGIQILRSKRNQWFKRNDNKQ